MACFSPLFARYRVDGVGKKHIMFSAKDAHVFYTEKRFPERDDYFLSSHDLRTLQAEFDREQILRPFPIQLPCGQCIGCLLERSRQWAVRCMHEASLYDDNSFITLTYSPESLDKLCPDGSLVRKHFQDFMKRLRFAYPGRIIRVFYCGEYGEKLGRPHFHAALFNFDFEDKSYWKSQNGYRYYRSAELEALWPHGYSVIGELTFESAAYIARYCLKKVNGSKAEEYYTREVPSTGELVKLAPEFCQASLKPGIGAPWFEKYGMTDVYPRDECIVRGACSKPPRYYDKLLERMDPALFNAIKLRRDERRLLRKDDNTYLRLLDKQKCQRARLSRLIRTIEAIA